MIGVWILLGLLVVTSSLMTIAIGGNANLVKENRRLRRALAEATHPSARIAPGEHPIFDATLAEIRSLPTADSTGGAA